MPPQCRAFELSDPTAKTPCDKPATSSDGRLCGFHARQCHALYKGYKRRNAQLDNLANLMPAYLASTKTALVNQNFEDVDAESTLRELHSYLFKKQNILSSVIRGRKLHHSHFFAVDMDYGHEKYLAQLQKEKHTIARALERLGRRTAEILYAKRSWFQWVRQCQDDEEAQRENESKKVKLEAQLFRRHQKEVTRHQNEVRARENQKRAEAFLNEVYTQRLSEMTEAEQEEWDPVQDVAEDERGSYIDLIKYFLMLKDSDSETTEATKLKQAGNSNRTESAPANPEAPKISKGAKKRGKKSMADPSKTDPVKTNPAKANPRSGKTNSTTAETGTGGGASNIEMETQAQIRSRLREGVKYYREKGMYIAGTIDSPLKLIEKSAPMPDNEIDRLLQDIAQIKTLLFCRLLLSHAKLLPVALRVDSIEEFLNDAEVTLEDLRDLCLKVEQPALQEVRDACADFARGDEEEGSQEDDNTVEEEGDEDETSYGYRPRKVAKRDRLGVGHVYQTKREKAMIKKRQEDQKISGLDDPGAFIDFGIITDEGKFSKKKMRIKICGHYIHNYPSEKAMSRGGWFHFCVIAKDSDLFDAITLCRHWDEFYELNVLATYHYFPGTNWMTWVGDRLRNQLMTLGFIPYVQNDAADEYTTYYQSPRRQGRRSHHVAEMRNFICGHVKRNDAASRRLIQYLSMETSQVIVLVRDARTGRVLVTPPDDQLWLVREKMGLGRASKNDYHVLRSVGPEFFEEMDGYRRWHFGFTDYYDIYLWDAEAGEPYPRLYNKLRQMLLKAQRCITPLDYFKLAGPVIKTLTRDRSTMRARTIKPGEVVQSIWDEIHHPETRMRAVDLNGREVNIEDSLMSYLYNEADVLEDQILFPEEVLQNRKNELFRDNPSEIQKFERGPPGDIRRFVYDLDTDDELSDDEDHLRITEGQSLSCSSQEGDPKEDNDDEWTDESDESSMGEDQEKALIRFEYEFKESLAKGVKEDRMRDLAKPLLDATIRWPSADTSMIDADMMAIMRLSLSKTDKDYSDTSEETMRKEWMRFMDREKSKIFKDCWHKADLSPGAAENYAELLKVVRKADDYLMSKINMGPYEMLAFMGMASKITQHRRIIPDAFHAYAAICMFSETTDFITFASESSGLDLSESLLLKQAERAKHPPSRRTYRSNKTIDKDLFKAWDDLLRVNRKKPGQAVDDIYPLEWDIAVRPIVANLYKAGVIANSYAEFVSGQAVAIAEPSRPMDLYIDWRLDLALLTLSSSRPIIPDHLEDPTKLTPETLLDRASKFAASNPGARFSLLRLWSAPHFYPLMIGYDRRASTTFLDSVGRSWEWKFIPKDMPCSEWSIHNSAKMRIDPYKRQLGDQVVLKRDLYLVMGKDEADCRLRSAGVTWAVQTEPWRLEVDFWRSFVGVDLKFLEGLDREWLD
ncbi:uncharacterized protein BDZ99DRAFT_444814 [Mytilinidion resinicola]|uniref:Uncharacterized protein n=1 Tax=Mytilinidion resinicola TaxID=574789 RepID=A0A6A6YK51_9PEZI|nr:uncharacterized protein BDZ99DRAFT_444814 [Mytilinidion resinicola]KAF2808929.1 hypothetical protein BDZ99DRAFT_444814 [Mytilinidion resinicola]